jgi:hypothetical protein
LLESADLVAYRPSSAIGDTVMADKNMSWKSALLGSGLPLEASVANELRQIGCFSHGEFEFSVKNDHGSLIQRSVDITAWWDLPALKLDLLVECKYRRPGVQWVLIPARSTGASDDIERVTDCFVSPFVPPWLLPPTTTHQTPPLIRFWHYAPPPLLMFPVVEKGTEILPGDRGEDPAKADQSDKSNAAKKNDSAHETGIRTALMQVRLGAASTMFWVPPISEAEFDNYLYTQFRFILPIIVTTASLLVLRSNAGIPDIESSTDIERIARRADAVIVKSYVPRSLRNFIVQAAKSQFERHAKSMRWKRLVVKQRLGIFQRHGANSSFVDVHAMCGPSAVLVTTLNYLPTLLRNIAASMADVRSLVAHSPQTLSYTGAIPFDIIRHARLQSARRPQEAPSM